jgi:biopolymer transport protein ExbD
MKLKRRPARKARIEIIPMIDTMFFLLVFFMVATLSMTVQQGLSVNLPHAVTARDELRQMVTLTLTKEGKLFFNKEPVSSPAEAASRLARWKETGTEATVVINADRSAEHGSVVALMDAIRRAGVTKMAIAANPSDIPINQREEVSR